MGYIRDHAIVVVGDDRDFIDRAHAEATRIFPWVGPISPPMVNGSRSFFVPPDGSKECWTASDMGDARRDEFIRWLRSIACADGSSPLAWIEVRVSDDGGDVRVERHAGDGGK